MDFKATLGLVLAGGKSTRMGSDKALLEIKGETLLARALRLLSYCELEELAVSRAIKCNHQIEDIIPNKGPLSGIHAAMHQFPHYNILVMPVDQVLLSPETINTMIHLAQSKQINYCANTCKTNSPVQENPSHRFNFPLFIHNTEQARAYLASVLQANSSKRALSVFGFLKQFPLAYLPVKNASELSNINSPEQFELILKTKFSSLE